MVELPEGMLQHGRAEDDVFETSEHLYRRVPHDRWEEDYINLDAIELPDMSVNRQKYGPPQWVRLLSEEYHDWGVIGFQVEDIPPEMQHLGIHIYRFRPRHVPHRRNYPHSEVQAYYARSDSPSVEEHIDSDFLKREQALQLESLFPDVLQLRWREQLRRKCRIIIQAYQEA